MFEEEDREVPSVATYQREFAQRIIGASAGARIVLLSPPGYGRSTAIVEAVAGIVARNPASRVLVIAPMSALVAQWAHRLRSSGAVSVVGLDGSAYRKLELSGDLRLLGGSGVYVTNASLLIRPNRRSALTASHWDLVILDDVLPDSSTVRGAALRQLWDSKEVAVAVAAGNVLAIVRPEIASLSNEWVVWNRETLASSSRSLPAHEIVEERFTLTEAERNFREQLARFLPELPEAMSDELRLRSKQSLFAVSQFLASALATSEARPSGLSAPAQDVGNEPDEHVIALPDRFREKAEHLLELLEEVGTDSKLGVLAQVLERWKTGPRRGGILIYLRRRDTADYVATSLRDRLASFHEAEDIGPVLLLTGDLAESERIARADLANRSRSPVLIATDASVHGVDLRTFSDVVHFDLPRSLESLWVRVNRVGGVGHRHQTVRHHVLAEDGEDAAQFAKVALHEIDVLEKTLGVQP